MVTKSSFGPYDAYTLSNGELEVCIITLGATVVSLKYKGKERSFLDDFEL